MGAEFIYAATEMPPVPTIDGRGLHHDDAAKQAIFDRLTEIIFSDDALLGRLLDEHYIAIMDENAAVHTDGVYDWDDEQLLAACASDVVNAMCGELREWWRGDYDREWTTMDTYNAKGEKIVLSIAGDMSWGDVPAACNILWRFGELPQGWWKNV